jgi:hypothetical protein
VALLSCRPPANPDRHRFALVPGGQQPIEPAARDRFIQATATRTAGGTMPNSSHSDTRHPKPRCHAQPTAPASGRPGGMVAVRRPHSCRGSLGAGSLAAARGALMAVARRHHATPAQVALAWLLRPVCSDAADPRHLPRPRTWGEPGRLGASAHRRPVPAAGLDIKQADGPIGHRTRALLEHHSGVAISGGRSLLP